MCSYEPCTEPIERGEKVVVGRRKVKTAAGIRTFNFVWHPKCWLAQLDDYLDSIPEGARLPVRGRKSITTNPELKSQRMFLLRCRASLRHRQLQAALHGDLDMVCDLEVRIQALIPQMEATGPLPKRWRVE